MGIVCIVVHRKRPRARPLRTGSSGIEVWLLCKFNVTVREPGQEKTRVMTERKGVGGSVEERAEECEPRAAGGNVVRWLEKKERLKDAGMSGSSRTTPKDKGVFVKIESEDTRMERGRKYR